MICNLENKGLKSIPNDLGDVRYLYLDNNEIKDLHSLFRYPDLRCVSLKNNNLQKFPKEIKFLKNLEELFLDNNKIKSIPKFKNTKLEVFTASQNEITEIGEFFLPALIKLDLSQNLIKALPNDAIPECQLGDFSYNLIGKIWHFPKKLLEIDLSFNRFYYPPPFHYPPKLQKFNIHGNPSLPSQQNWLEFLNKKSVCWGCNTDEWVSYARGVFSCRHCGHRWMIY